MTENVGLGGSTDIILALSSALTRDAVREALAKTRDLRVAGEARNWPQLEALVQQRPPGILLLSASLPGILAPDVLSTLARYLPETRVVLIVRSDVPPEQMGEFNILQPWAVLTGDVHMEDLIRGLELVRHDLMVLPPAYARSPVPLRGSRDQPRPSLPGKARLTPRERDLLKMFAQGYSEKEVAASLGIGRRTIHTHLEHIRSKLGASNRMHAVALVVAAHVVVPDDHTMSAHS